MIDPLPEGTRLADRYQIVAVLGQGGCGRTYRAIDERSGQTCVLKEFVPLTQNPKAQAKARELFEQEIALLRRLDSPQIPKVFDSFAEGDRLVAAQDFIDGQNYLQAINDRSCTGDRFSETEVRQWLADLLPVLDYLHHNNIIHRDISPDNVMRPANGGKPVLIDFGAVKEKFTQVYNSKGTSIVGKQGYGSPEQVMHGDCSARSDLYSLGVTALVMLTGKDPKDLRGKGIDLDWTAAKTWGEDLDRILQGLIRSDPDDRFASAGVVMRELGIEPPPLVRLAPPSDRLVATETIIDTPSPVIDSSHKTHEKIGHTRVLEAPPTVTVPLETKLSEPAHPPLPWFRRKTLAAGAIVAVVLLGAAGAAAVSYRPICGGLGTCLMSQDDRRWQEVYDQASRQANDSRLAADAASNLTQLQGAQANLQTAIGQLDSIPQGPPAYDLAKNEINRLRPVANDLATRSQQEAAADQALQASKSLAAQAKNAYDPATVRRQWQAAIEKLEEIDRDRFPYPEAQTLKAEYETSLAALADDQPSASQGSVTPATGRSPNSNWISPNRTNALGSSIAPSGSSVRTGQRRTSSARRSGSASEGTVSRRSPASAIAGTRRSTSSSSSSNSNRRTSRSSTVATPRPRRSPVASRPSTPSRRSPSSSAPLRKDPLW